MLVDLREGFREDVEGGDRKDLGAGHLRGAGLREDSEDDDWRELVLGPRMKSS